MKATAHFKWDNGTTASFQCNWHESGFIDEGDDIADEVYSSEKYEKENEGEMIESFVQSDDNPEVRKDLLFQSETYAVYTKPIAPPKN